MSIYSAVNTVIIIAAILSPITIIASVFGFYKNLKSDKRESLEMTSSIQNSLFSLMMGMLMRSPQPLNKNAQPFQQPSQQGTDGSNGFVNWNSNSEFYNDPNVYQIPSAGNSRANYMTNQMLKNSMEAPKTKDNGFLIGLLTGLVVFLSLIVLAKIGK